MDIKEYVDGKFTIKNKCWIWKGSTCGRDYKTGKGYGHFVFKGKTYLSHRVFYEIYKGSIPSGYNVLHTCDNPPCINPDHLYIGTQKDNVSDMIKKGRGNFLGHAKFSISDIKNIRERRGMGEMPTMLAKEYKTTYKHIWQIVNRKRWKFI